MKKKFQATENSTSNSDDRTHVSYRKKLLSTQSEPSVGSINENVESVANVETSNLRNSIERHIGKHIFKSVEK